MNQSQTNRLAMYKKVQAVFTDAPTAWENEDPVVIILDLFDIAVTDIETAAQEQLEKQTTGHTAEKNLQREALIDATFALMRRLRAFAGVAKDQVLLQDTNYSRSKLAGRKDSTLLGIARLVAQRADEYKTAAVGYKITPAGITALNSAIAAFEPLPTQAGMVASDRSLATSSLYALFKEANRLLKLLDDLVPALIEDQPFVERYEMVRKVNNRSSHGAAPALPVQPADPN